MRRCGSLWVLVDPNAFLEVDMGPYWSLSVLVGPYRSLCVFIDSNGSIKALISSFAILWVPMSPYKS